jgi:two-component system, OmpR family, response regulator
MGTGWSSSRPHLINSQFAKLRCGTVTRFAVRLALLGWQAAAPDTISQVPMGFAQDYPLTMTTRTRSLKGRKAPRLLIVDDDREIRDLLSALLTRRGYTVLTAREEREMRQALGSSQVDLIILDLMLPGKDGLTICRELRAATAIPIIMLTARGEPTDRIVGLEIGADDYLPKPFEVRELEARIRAVLRRSGAESSRPDGTLGARFTFAGWTLDARQRQLSSPEGVVVELTSGEFDLLLVFAERPQRVLSRHQLMDLARGREATAFDRSIDVQVSRLRRKIEGVGAISELIKTVRSSGYIFTPAVQRA